MNSIWVSEVPSEIPCVICKNEVYEFYIPSDIWNKVIRKNGKETDKEYLCLNCFWNALRDELNLKYE